MEKPRQPQTARFLALAAFAALSLGASKCSGVPAEKASLPCDASVAEIMIWDGRIQKICGCGGVDGEFAAANTALTCTYSLSTVKTLTIFYQGPFLQHQFLAVGTPAAPNGPIFDPSAKQPIRAHSVNLTAAGTYQFQDGFDHTIFGSIVATP